MASFSFLKRLFPLAALCGALAVLPGCQETEKEIQEEAQTPAEVMYPVHFVAREIETKTVFGEQEGTGYPTFWSANDNKVAVSLNLAGAKEATVTPAADFKTATFDASFPQSEVQAPYVFYALTPYSACISATVSHGGYHLVVPAVQTPLATSCDEAAQLLAASKGAESIAAFSQVEFQFTHVTAYGKLTLKNLQVSDMADIKSIELTASMPFAGEFYYAFSDASLTESAASQTITLLPDNLTLADGQIQDIWFACAPADLSSGSLTVVVNTTGGKWARTLEFTPAKPLAFNAGQVSKFSVSMADAVFTETQDRWVLVTDASTLASNDEIIFASSATPGAAAYALSRSNTQANATRDAKLVSIAQDSDLAIILKDLDADVATFTLERINSGIFRILENTATPMFLCASNDNSNGFYSVASVTGGDESYANWRFYPSSENDVIVSTNAKIQAYWRMIRFYAVSNSHSFIAGRSSRESYWQGTLSGTSSVYIYRKQSGASIEDDPILNNSEYGAYLTSGNHAFVVGCQLSREYPADGTVSFAILTPVDNRVDEFRGIPANPVKDDTFTLHYKVIAGSEVTDMDYPVTVRKVDGPKVWLSDGSGNGFIVKK